MTEDWVKVRGDSAGAARRRLRSAHHRGAVGDALLRPRRRCSSSITRRAPRCSSTSASRCPRPRCTLVATGPVQPFARSRDDSGRDVSAVVALATIAAPRFRRAAAPIRASRARTSSSWSCPTRRRAAGRCGWSRRAGCIRPTARSTSRSARARTRAPRGLSLEVADARRPVPQVRAGLGFPAGKDKTVLIDLDRRLSRDRARAACASRPTSRSSGIASAGRSAVPTCASQPRRLTCCGRRLRYRGYSVDRRSRCRARRSARATPCAGTAPRWRDLEGYYTRFGDVRELLRGIDDRYVIMNAGDELALRFRGGAAAGARHGPRLRRDRRRLGQGRRLQHRRSRGPCCRCPRTRSGRYDTAPRQLEDDPVYRRTPEDFADVPHALRRRQTPARCALPRASARRQTTDDTATPVRCSPSSSSALLATPLLIRRFGGAGAGDRADRRRRAPATASG